MSSTAAWTWALASLLVACAGDPAGHTASGQPLDYTGPDRAPQLQMEVDYVATFAPNATTMKWARIATEDLLHMPGAVTVTLDDELPAEQAPESGYTLDDVRALERAYRSSHGDDASSVMYLLFLDGSYHGDTEELQTMGLAYSGSAVVVFMKTLRTLCSAYANTLTDPLHQQAACPLAIATTWVHELGHLVGLVNRGTPMVVDHLDPDHGPHDQDPNCIMYWLNTTPSLFDVLEARILEGADGVQPFCDHCLADVAAVRSGDPP